MKALSRKNANMPSIANVCPMTPPAYLEKPAQLVPNWNSIGMPVTTPDGEIQPEDLGPELRGQVVLLIARPQRTPFPIDQEPRQAPW